MPGREVVGVGLPVLDRLDEYLEVVEFPLRRLVALLVLLDEVAPVVDRVDELPHLSGDALLAQEFLAVLLDQVEEGRDVRDRLLRQASEG